MSPARQATSPTSPAAARLAAASTHDRILAYLGEHATAGAAELSQAWGLTRADIRYHLAALVEEGLIELVPRDPAKPAGRGRPSQVYRLAALARPNNLPALCHALLAALLTGIDDSCRAAALRSLGPVLVASLAGEFSPAPNLTRRLNQVVEILNRTHYRARWEAGAQGPRILLRACPYAAILAQHPEICQVDQALLEQLLQAPLFQAARLNPVTGKPPACIFTLT